MNILEVKVEGFGIWKGLRLAELPRGVTVFYGPNEAGKTTLLQFTRSMLFGFSPERRERYLPPLRGGVAGGSLRIVAPQGHYQIQRHDGGSNPAIGDLAIAGPNGPLHGDHLLATLLSGIDEAVFSNVFAIGLREIQELGTLSDSGAGTLLYRLTTGLDRVSLADVLRELNASRNRLLTAVEEKPSQVVQLLADRDRLVAEVEQLRKLTGQYSLLSDERDRIDIDVRQAENEQADLEKAYRLAEIAIATRDKWHDREDLARQLSKLARLRPLAEGMVEKHDDLRGRIAQRTDQLSGWKKQRADWAQKITALQVNDLVWRQAPRIEAIVEQKDWATALEAETDALRVELLKLEQQVADSHKQWGFKPGKDQPLPEMQISTATLRRLRPLAREYYLARKALHGVKDQDRKAGDAASSVQQEIRQALAGRGDSDLGSALDKAGTLVSMLRRRIQLDERIDQMAGQRRELADQITASLDRQLLPARFLAALGSLFVLGMVLILSASFLGSSFLTPAGWTIAVLGLMASLVGGGVKFIYERSMKNQLTSAQRQLKMVDAQFNQSKDERDQIDAELPRGGGPLLMRLQTAEKDLAALEKHVGLEGRRQAADQEADRVRNQSQDLRETFANAKRRWQHGLASAGLPKNVLPQHLKRLTAHYRSFEELCQRLEQCRKEHAQRARELEGFHARLAKLLVDVKLTPTSDRSADRVRQLEQELQEQQKRVARRDELRKQRLELGQQGKKELRILRVERRQRLDLLRRCGVRDEAALRRLAAQNALKARLQADHDRLSHDITVALGPANSEDDLAATFEKVPASQLEKHTLELADGRRAASAKLQKLSEERGQLTQQLKLLADDRRLPGKLMDLQLVEEQLQEAVDRWQTFSVTQRLLESIRRTYEAEHQPETLREATSYFKQLTGGHYVRVWTPLDDDVLRVDDEHGQTLAVEALSRGTREQLFLSLRLALVSAFGRRGANLPLVLDDVLVNFDVQRVAATAKVLKQFATGGFQVLMFTCHEHIARIFQTLEMEVRVLPSNSEINATAGKPLDIAPEPEPEPEPVEPEVAVVEEEPIDLEPEEVFIPEPEPVAVEIEYDDAPRPQPVLKPAPPPPQPVAVAPEPKPEPPPPPAKPPQRVRRRRPGPFANAIWHEHVEEEIEVPYPAAGSNGNGHHHWDEDDNSYAFGQLADEPEDIEAA